MTIAIANKEPNTGRLQKEDNNVVNIADLAGGSDITFHDAATVASNGTVVAVGGFKNLTVEIYGTSTSRTVTFYGKSKSGTLRPMQGVRVSDFAMSLNSTTKDEIWQFDITGLDYVVMDLTAVAGGDVSVKGRMIA